MLITQLTLFLLLCQVAPVEPQGISLEPADSIRVDRGLQLVVFPNRVRLQYDLGLSPQAATALLDKNSRPLPDAGDRRALMEAVHDLVLPDIQRRCRITADGIPLALKPIESLVFPKHYVQLSCIFEAPLPSTDATFTLKLIDGSFRGYDGNHIIALKTDDGVELQSSTVPLILARAPRQSLSNERSAAEREAARRAEAVIKRPVAVADLTQLQPERPTPELPTPEQPTPEQPTPSSANTNNPLESHQAYLAVDRRSTLAWIAVCVAVMTGLAVWWWRC